jgi:D-alanine-D-alanine ligase
MNIALLTGGLSSEREVSLSSGRGILKGLRNLGYNVTVIDPIFGKEVVEEEIVFKDKVSKEYPTLDKIRLLQKESSRKLMDCLNSDLFNDIDLVFIGLHGKYGEDGKIQTLLELRGLKYTGSGIQSSSVAMDKDISKVIFEKNNIPTPDWIAVTKKDVVNYSECVERFGIPLVIKPNDEGSTVGLTIAKSKEEFTAGLETAFNYSEKILIEKYIKGRELTVSIVDGAAYPVIEIVPKEGFYDYEHKYSKGMSDYICPAIIDKEVADKASQLALHAYKSLSCKVYARVDFLLTEDNRLYCLEVNTLPGMTELSLVPKAAKAVGIDFDKLLEKIIDSSLKKYV